MQTSPKKAEAFKTRFTALAALAAALFTPPSAAAQTTVPVFTALLH